MKKVNIFLDDDREPTFIKNKLGFPHKGNYTDDTFYPKDWIVVRDYFQFVKAVDKYFPNINLVSFDHDIKCFDKNNKEWTGKDAADYLIGKCLDTGEAFPNFYVHTMNTSGRMNIIGIILNYLKHVENKKLDWRYYNNGLINGEII